MLPVDLERRAAGSGVCLPDNFNRLSVDAGSSGCILARFLEAETHIVRLGADVRMSCAEIVTEFAPFCAPDNNTQVGVSDQVTSKSHILYFSSSSLSAASITMLA